MGNTLKPIAFIFCAVLFWPSLTLAVELKAPTEVTAATIYSDRALVSRSGTIELPAGPQTIIVENMPAGFNESSLRVQGKGDAAVKIGAVEVKHVYLAELAQAAEREKSKALQAKQDEKIMIEADVRALQIRSAFIERVAGNGASNQPEANLTKLDFTPEKWGQAWALLQTGMSETQRALAGKQIAMRVIDEEIAQLNNDLRQVQTRQRERRDLIIHVEAKAATLFDFTLTYQTPGAFWRPVYDARLDTGKAELLLEQYGQVGQQTGEDWKNVSLTLSTARPELGTEMPRIMPWYIRNARTAEMEMTMINLQIAGRGGQFQSGANASMAAEKSAMLDEGDALQEGMERKKENADLTAAQAVTSDYSAEFRVPGRVDLKSVATPAKFFVGNQTMKAALFAQATPRLGPQAYLFAKVTNGEKFPIIPGAAAKYRDGAFMGNAAMTLLRPNEQIGLSFGIDDRIKVEYEKVRQSQDNPTLVFVGDVTVERAYKSKIKNLHDKPMAVTVFDQYPVAGDADIKTALLEDQTTAGFEKDKENRQGVIIWKGDYQPQEEKAFDLAFSVKYPKNKPMPRF